MPCISRMIRIDAMVTVWVIGIHTMCHQIVPLLVTKVYKVHMLSVSTS